jgi:eukaryotic-like serine/threonine-protein kinase
VTRTLDPARWKLLSPCLDEALDLEGPERLAWLAGLRGRDSALAAQLEALLANYERVEAEGFLEGDPVARPTLAGQTLGAYTLRSPIGHGGMGSVWLADRSDGRYEGVAAVKLLNASLVGQGAEERFRREGNILARLRHPHIAHLIDAGVSPAGQPFLVLEYVDGEPIDAYCDRRRLGVRERVRLFLDVLAAVAHAHANLVVHRDLKPSNVLVDRDGTVKLLDFGVAKLLTAEAAASTQTLTERALTLAYAAPEQLGDGDITTATDVFALGVLLYVLLAGRHPLEAALGESPGDVLRAILDREPARLSAEAPEGLRRALRGDLETIVAKALKKDPAERYASASALAEDLRRYLDYAPIAARPDTFGYRAARFVRRRRLPVALAGLSLMALTAGLAGTLWQARVAARQRDLALSQLVRAESINDFTSFLLGKAAPGGGPVTTRDLLARGEQLAAKRASDDPGLAVDLLVNVGDLYVEHDEPDNARRALKRAYELAPALGDPATRARVTCSWARAVSLGDDPRGALRLIDEGLALTTGDERFDGVVSACLLNRVSIGMVLDSAEIVSTSAREALRRLDRHPKARLEQRAAALQMLAMGHRLAGETAEADRMFARSFEQLQAMGLDGTMDMAALLSNWATNTSLTNPLASLAQNRRVVAIVDGAPDSVPLPSLQNYALQLSRVARYTEARVIQERARAVAQRHQHAQGLGLSDVRLAHVCLALGDLACARHSLRAAEAEVPAAYPPGHRTRGDLAREQSLLAEAEGRDADAHRLMLEAFAIHRPVKEKSLTQIETFLELSRLELRLGSAAEAEQRAREALAVAESFRGGTPHSSWVGRSLLALGAARRAQGDAAGGRELLTQAVAHMTPTLGPAHPDVIDARRRLGR